MKTYVLLLFLLTGCAAGSYVNDIKPFIESEFNEPKSIHYPSTDYKVSAIVVDQNGDVFYFRIKAKGEIRDNKKVFNINDYCDNDSINYK